MFFKRQLLSHMQLHTHSPLSYWEFFPTTQYICQMIEFVWVRLTFLEIFTLHLVTTFKDYILLFFFLGLYFANLPLEWKVTHFLLCFEPWFKKKKKKNEEEKSSPRQPKTGLTLTAGTCCCQKLAWCLQLDHAVLLNIKHSYRTPTSDKTTLKQNKVTL